MHYLDLGEGVPGKAFRPAFEQRSGSKEANFLVVSLLKDSSHVSTVVAACQDQEDAVLGASDIDSPSFLRADDGFLAEHASLVGAAYFGHDDYVGALLIGKKSGVQAFAVVTV